MTDSGGLGAVALVLYLWECAAWVPEEAEAYHTSLRRRGRLARESWALERPPGRIVLGPLLPGTGGVALCEARPPRLSPLGVCACAMNAGGPAATGGAGSTSAEAIPWERLEPIRADGRTVRSGPRAIAKTGTPAYAAQLACVAEDVRRAGPERRAKAIEQELDRLLDDEAVRAQAARLRRASWMLRALIWTMTLLLAVVVPLALARRSWIVLIASLAVAWAMAVVNAVVYSRRRRELVGSPGVSDHALTMVLLPLAALRADDLLARDAFAMHHALAVARGSDVAPPWVRPEPAPDEADAAPCCAAGAWIDEAWSRRVAARSARSAPEAASRPPRRESPDAVAYCPRCLQQYARTGPCADCPGVELLPIE